MHIVIKKKKLIKATCKILKCLAIFVVFFHITASLANATNQYHLINKKITICHNVSDNPQTIRIYKNELNEYLSNGSYLGKCKVKLDVSKVNDISFGSLVVNSSGLVKLDPESGVRTSTGGVFLIEGDYRFARFIVRGTPNAEYFINLPRNVMINSPKGNAIRIRRLKSFPHRHGRLNANGEQEIIVGGALKVRNRADSGNYSGVFNIDVRPKN